MSSTSKRQLGWYLRNVVNSEDTTELLTVVLRHMSALSDNDRDWLPLGRGELPADGGPEYQRIKADLLEQLSIFGEAPCGPEPYEANALHAAATFHLSPLDLELLRLVLRAGRRVRVKTFGDAVRDELCDTVAALAALLGRSDAEISERLLPEAPLRASGLLVFNEDGSNLLSSFPILSMPDRLARLMVRNYASAEAWVAAVVGRPRTTMLDWADFAHLGERAGLAAKVLRASAAEGAIGVHILLSGPPGTGKTEFAKVLAARAGLRLFAAGEEGDKDDDEPSRAERLAALRMATSMLRGVADTAVLLDEAEDVLEGRSSFGTRRGEVSKAFLNRMLEEAPRPIIWTTNSLTGMDPATLRRMTLVVEMEVPNLEGRERIWGRVLHQEGLNLGSDLAARLAAQWPASAGVSVAAARAARLSGDGVVALETHPFQGVEILAWARTRAVET